MIGLLLTVYILTMISFFLNKRDLIAPSFLFCAGFAFAITWAVVYASRWDLDLHLNTYLVLSGGIAEYVIVTWLTSLFMDAIRGRKKYRIRQKLQYISVPNAAKIVVILFAFVICAATLFQIARIMASDLLNVMTAVTQYREGIMHQGTKYDSLPSWIGFGRTLVIALGYWFLYVFINNMLVHKKDWLSLAIVVIAMVATLTTGARGIAFFMIISAVVIYVMLKNKQSGFRKSIGFKMILSIMAIGLILLLSFRWTAELMGRYSDFKLADYIAIYCGAEIKNIDLFLQEAHEPTSIWGGQSFINLVYWLGPIFGIDTAGYKLDLPFRRINGFNLGNVYTTFYPYIYDFGVIGLILLVGLMAFISQWVYERAKRSMIGKKPSISLLVYEYISASIVFSFFSNKFYENVFCENFVRYLIFWVLFNWFFFKLFPHIRLGGRRIA